MIWGLLASFVAVAYATFAIVRATGAPPAAYAAVAPALLVLVLVFRATRPRRPDDDRAAATCARAGVTGALVGLAGVAAWNMPAGRVAMSLGAMSASLAGLRAVGVIRAEEGIVARHADPPRHAVAIALCALGWVAPSLLALLAIAAPESVSDVPATSFGYALSAASLCVASVTLAIGALDLARRRLELGAADRLRAFVTVAASLVGVAVIAGSLRLLPVAVLFVICALATAVCAVSVASTKSPETVGRLATQTAVLGALAVVPAIMLAAVAKQAAELAPIAVLGAAAAAALGGLSAPALARVLLPRTEPWSAAFEAATRAAIHPDPEPALERALVELRGLSKRKLEAPSLFRFEPATVTTVDLAGYARTDGVTIPESVAELSKGETERVLTADALRACAVRRPDVRPALQWLDDRRLTAVAVIREDDMPIGMLGLPRGERMSALTLAEARALGHLGRLLGAQLAAAAKLARARGREETATARADSSEKLSEEMVRELGRERDRGDAVTRVIAERALVATYSPGARLAIESLETFARDAQPLAVIVPPGVDVLPYLAVFHLASDRKSSALCVVDGRKAALADLERWRSESESPLAVARGGTLAIVDPHLLPRLVQAYIAAAYEASSRLERSERVQLAVVVPRTLDALVARGVVDERFADTVGDRALALPPLAARSEDLRALVIDKLMRIGLDRFGKALGIEPAALALLAEHDWPGNDAELDSMVVRMGMALPEGAEVVRRQDLVRIGFAVPAPKARAS